MPKTRQQKEEIKEILVQNFKQSPSVYFADYQGLNVSQADDLRKKMYEGQIKYIVAKKTLINMAAKEAGIEFDAKQLPGMIGIAFSSEDEIAPAKILGDLSKSTSLKLVGGIFDGASVDQDYVITLSKLPGREQLYSMFLSVINGPVSGFVRVLDAVRKQKEETESKEAQPPAEVKTEEAAPVAESPVEEAKTEEAKPESVPVTEEVPAVGEASAEAPAAEEPVKE
ncbi:50S ribosomal protein L10 [Patescibacteria group bacterium]|nr:50S ribosomal protein L10 [Patescibacteria group bacterium]